MEKTMGLKTDIYIRSRDGMNFLFECQMNPVMKGYQSRIADKAYAEAWRKMKDGEIPDEDEFNFAKLSSMNPDRMNDTELKWFVELSERASRHLKNNPNVNLRLKKMPKSSTNL